MQVNLRFKVASPYVSLTCFAVEVYGGVFERIRSAFRILGESRPLGSGLTRIIHEVRREGT